MGQSRQRRVPINTKYSRTVYYEENISVTFLYIRYIIILGSLSILFLKDKRTKARKTAGY